MSTCRIRVLPDLLVNKIAAGEVVERPASVVKELMENALDAGARRIAVEIEEGGRQLIRVTDDGCGMSAEELRLAVLPHATSKISVEDDLYAISTLGFRGEALASISSVSKLRIASRLADLEEGHEVRVVGERWESSQAAGVPPGTTVEVRDLFFNVPARRKFLRGHSTEVGHIHEQIARTALAHPLVAFELQSNRRVTLNLPPCGGPVERIARLYSDELAAALLKIGRNERGTAIEAYVAPPAQSRATAQWQYTYVNGRYIRDRFLQHAIKEAYRGLMEPARHAVVFLFLTLDPQSVDVNVHPTKLEVRWADSGLIHSQVLSALRETLQRCDLTPGLRLQRAAPQFSAEEQERMRREFAAVFRNTAPVAPMGPGMTGAPGPSISHAADFPERRPAPPQGMELAGQVWRSLYGTPAAPAQVAGEQPLRTDPPYSGVVEGPIRPRAIQLHNLYLVAETEDGIVIVDQHALHERIMYEHLRQRFTEGPLESQRLLLPETLTVTPQQAAMLDSQADLLHMLGIEITPFGVDAVAVHAFPALLKDTDVISFMRDLLDHLAQQPATPSTEVVIHQVLDMMACKAAVKAGDPLTDQEIDALMRQRHVIEKSSSCPHGRPTMLRFTKAELDRQFKRT